MNNGIAKAILRNIRISPRKIQLVLNKICGENIVTALAYLENTNRKSNPILKNLLQSAIANAMQKNKNINPDKLNIIEARADKGKVLKRIRPRARCKTVQILKKSSHVTISVG